MQGAAVLSKPLTWLTLSLVSALAAIGFAAWWLGTPHYPPPRAGGPASATGLQADIVIPSGAQAAPDFALKDQNGQVVTVSGLKGKVVAITFLDSHCTQLCPIEADQLAQTQRALGTTSPMTLLVVSVAPTTDTPESEQAFAATHHWMGDWHWVSGTSDQLASVWKAYSIAVQNSPQDILHTSVVYLIDRNGYERAGWAAGLQPNLLTHDVRLLNTQA